MARDAAKAGAVKGRSAKREIRVIERIVKLGFEFRFESLSNARPFDKADVQLREMRPVDRIAREVAERARRWRSEQTIDDLGLRCGTGC